VSAKQPKWVTLGRISGVFGVKGWLKVQSYTEPRDNIVRLAVWTLRMNGADRTFEVEDGQGHAGSVVAKLRGIDDRDLARDWAGAEIDSQSLFAAGRNRIEEPDALDVLPAASTATVRHDDVIEGTLDRATTCQPNDYHSYKP
jgi:hypothetical protein